MSTIKTSFGDVRIKIETEDARAYDIFRELNHNFNTGGIDQVKALARDENLRDFVTLTFPEQQP